MEPVQPPRWRSRAASSKNRSCVRVIRQPPSSGLMSTVTSDSRSGMLSQAQVKTSLRLATISL